MDPVDRIPTRLKRSFDTASAPGPSLMRDDPLTSSLRLEHGILKKRKPLKATLLAQDIPFWLLGIKSMDWKSINCLAYDSIRRPEVKASRDHLSLKLTIFPNQDALLKNSHMTDIGLISGTTSFLRSVLPLLPVSLPLLIHCERRSRRDSLLDSVKWTRVTHARVGGVTNQHIWLGVRGIPGWTLSPRVSRSIGHILSHSERPKPCQLLPTFPHYTSRDTLKRSKLHVPVVYPSHFSYTGFGHRRLTSDELCSAFDIPNWMKPNAKDLEAWLDLDLFASMLPLQLFSAALDETVPLISPAISIPKSIQSSQTFDDSSSHGIHLPAINKFLAHSWIAHGLVSEKAVKSDDAGVAIGMWNQRISLVLPASDEVLNHIRTLILGRLRRRNTRSLISFLSNVHGGDWMTRLSLLRQASLLRSRGGGQAAALCSSKKRKRGGSG